MGKKYPKTAPFPWDFVTLWEKDQATAIGNMHRKMVKIVRVVPEISWRTDRQTDGQTDGRTNVLITILQLQQTVKIFTEHNCYCKTLREMSKNTQNTKKLKHQQKTSMI